MARRARVDPYPRIVAEAAILVVDDDTPIRRMLERTLGAEGYEVRSAADGGAALAAIERFAPDVLVLDVAMPGVDGLGVCRRVRAKGLALPILLLTARDAVEDRVAGLDAGADDYLVKPFAAEELLARLRALLRRGQEPGETLAVGDVIFDVRSRLAARAGRDLDLSAREADLLELLLRNARNVVPREMALDRVWGGPASSKPQRRRSLRLVSPAEARRPTADRDGAGRRVQARGMTGLSIRSRAVIAAALSILLAVVSLGIAVDFVVERHLRHSLDSSLRRRAVAVAQLSASAPALLTAPGALESPLGGTDASVEVLDRRGRLVARSLGLGGRVLPAAALARRVIASGTPAFGDAIQAGDGIRLYVAPLAELRGPASGGAVVVAASTGDLEDTLRALRAGVVLSALGAAALGAAAVALLLGRALRPLKRLASSAAEIERTADPGRRLPETCVDDEVGRLATTLNAMLGSLERSREAQQRFVADASHELRTPLTALQGNVSYLARHGATPELVADLQEDTDRLVRLADDLITVSREEAAAAPAEEVALDRLVGRLVEDDPHVVLTAQPSHVRGDRAALERAISNLVQNARLHGPARRHHLRDGAAVGWSRARHRL